MTFIWLYFAFLLCIELQPIINALYATYPKSQLTTLLYASDQAVTGLMLLVIWFYAAKWHRLIVKAMERSQIISIAIILFCNEYATSLWLLVIVPEAAEQSSNEEKPTKCCRGKCAEE